MSSGCLSQNLVKSSECLSQNLVNFSGCLSQNLVKSSGCLSQNLVKSSGRLSENLVKSSGCLSQNLVNMATETNRFDLTAYIQCLKQNACSRHSTVGFVLSQRQSSALFLDCSCVRLNCGAVGHALTCVADAPAFRPCSDLRGRCSSV
ncbi:hypothetical protein BgiMline_024306 [Biomphalaria glabrata]|nr:hypothetical protein BgiMline_007506 [Biomphalaria glabrata]